MEKFKVFEEEIEDKEKLPDFGDYINSRKEIVLPIEEAKEIKEELEKNKGSYVFDSLYVSDSMETPSGIRFIDKDANVSKVEIYMKEIAEFAEEADEITQKFARERETAQLRLKALKKEIQESIESNLGKLGFQGKPHDEELKKEFQNLWQRIDEAQEEYQKKLREQKN